MWYEILPSFGIILAAMAAPHYIAYVGNKLVIGNAYRRSLLTPQHQHHYLRDRRLNDDPYKVTGLEGIPDN